ncbi:SpoIID/LytB domain-containing protein [Candidatus Dojkabacteria bacterium]|nr:SpoIID/LytB domain-containing protein [Candidatus Dojkabacteria bacterium]
MGYVFAETDYDEEIKQKENEKSDKESELEESEQLEYSYQKEGLSISERISALSKDLKGIEEDISSSEEELKEIEADLKKKEEKKKESEEKVAKVSKSLYKISRINVVEIILSAENISELAARIGFIKFGAGGLVSELRDYQEELSEVAASYNDLSESRLELERKREKLEEDQIALENQKRLYEQMAAAEASKQGQLVNEIASIVSDIDQLSTEAQEAMKDKGGGYEVPDGGGGETGGGTSPQQPMGDPGKYDVYRGSTKIASNVSGPVRIVPASGGYFSIDGGIGKYRGILEMRADTNVYVINEIDFELYLRGLGEVPSSWHMETLKAQSVAGRTYAAANWNKRSSYGYNLRDDVYDQNYVGYSKEIASGGDRWVSAVGATESKVLYSGSSIIAAYYHSTCGGHTLSSQEVWGGSRSYAQAESDWYNSGGWKSYDSASPWSYKRWCGGSSSSCTSAENINDDSVIDLLNAAIYLSADPNSSTRQSEVRRQDLGGLSPSQIVSKLGSGNTITDKVGMLQNVQSIYNGGSTSINSNSRKTEKVRVTGSNGTYDVDGASFWLVFNVRAPGTAHIFYSNFWTVKKESGLWNFYTRGYPHRVGMCQYGAQGRANAGQSYSAILAHYYRGTTLKSFSPPSIFRVGLTKVGGPTTIVSSNKSFDIYADGNKVTSGESGQTWKIVKR